MDYCCVVWGNTSQQNLDRIHHLQKRAARLLLDTSYKHPSLPLFLKLGWLPIHERIKYFRCLTVFRALTNLTPSCGSPYGCHKWRLSACVLAWGQRGVIFRCLMPQFLRYMAKAFSADGITVSADVTHITSTTGYREYSLCDKARNRLYCIIQVYRLAPQVNWLIARQAQCYMISIA